MAQQTTQEFKRLKKLPVRTMDWIGSVSSLVVHTILFALSFLLGLVGAFEWDRILLVLTTLVSLEAIYMAIFIQMGVNRTAQGLQDVEEDIEGIQEGFEDLQEDVSEIQEDVHDLGEDVEDISEDIDEIQKDDQQEEVSDKKQEQILVSMESQLKVLMKEIEALKHNKNN
jgi:uncharacterized membrane protein